MTVTSTDVILICEYSYCYYLLHLPYLSFFFFFNDTATTEIYTLSLHDALPIFLLSSRSFTPPLSRAGWGRQYTKSGGWCEYRSEEHTSELQSQSNLVCRLLLEKKKNQSTIESAQYTVLVTFDDHIQLRMLLLSN